MASAHVRTRGIWQTIWLMEENRVGGVADVQMGAKMGRDGQRSTHWTTPKRVGWPRCSLSRHIYLEKGVEGGKEEVSSSGVRLRRSGPNI